MDFFSETCGSLSGPDVTKFCEWMDERQPIPSNLPMLKAKVKELKTKASRSQTTRTTRKTSEGNIRRSPFAPDPSSRILPSIRDLCDSDKARIAELIKELGRVISQKEDIVHQMKTEKATFQNQLCSLNSEKQGLMQERVTLQEQLTKTQALVADLQQQLSLKLQFFSMHKALEEEREKQQTAARSQQSLNASSCDSCGHRCTESKPRRHFTEHIDAELRRAQAEPVICSSPLPVAPLETNNCCAESTPDSDAESAMEARIAELDARNSLSRRQLLIREREMLGRQRRCLMMALAEHEKLAERQDAQQSPPPPRVLDLRPFSKRRDQSASAPVSQRSKVVRPKSPHSVNSVVIRPGVLNRAESRASSRTPSSLCESVNIQLPETEEETSSPNHFVRHDRYTRRPGRSPPSPPSSILDIVESMNGAEEEEEDEQEDDENRLLEDVFFVKLL